MQELSSWECGKSFSRTNLAYLKKRARCSHQSSFVVSLSSSSLGIIDLHGTLQRSSKTHKMPVASIRSSDSPLSKNRETNAKNRPSRRRPVHPQHNPWKKMNTKIANLSFFR
jgi:hypothetical protein